MTALVAALGLVVGYGWLIWQAPRLLVPDLRSPIPSPSGTLPTLSPAERATAAYNARVLVVSLAGATVVLAGLLYTARNYRLSHRGQVTDRFTKALERLGSTELYVRIGGIHALQQVLHDSPEQHAQVLDVLVAFIRQRAPRAMPNDESPIYPRPAPSKPAPDVQAALTTIGRRRRRPNRELSQLDLSGLHLDGVQLAHAELRGANLFNTRLRHANLAKADLRKASLASAQLDFAKLENAQLQEASLMWTVLKSANLQDAQLQGATLSGTCLDLAHLSGAQLQGAKLIGTSMWRANLGAAQLQGADLLGAQLQGADLYGWDGRGAAQGLTISQLADADFDDETRLPAELRRGVQAYRSAYIEFIQESLLTNLPRVDYEVRRGSDGDYHDLVVSGPSGTTYVKGGLTNRPTFDHGMAHDFMTMAAKENLAGQLICLTNKPLEGMVIGYNKTPKRDVEFLTWNGNQDAELLVKAIRDNAKSDRLP
ncbi:pentapeptide repeat-containing protein [Actinoplanes sp. NPDC051513]|uniref:pentapeptide repeat-containing protein n=1 Tax=Actinoplanes sp. NPDC051513 TaxID=3363908 RepID=UPI003788C6D6